MDERENFFMITVKILCGNCNKKELIMAFLEANSLIRR